MKFSEQWLREWIDPPVDTDTLARQLTMAGLEVAAVEPVAAVFSDVVVAEVLACEPHPEADKLKVCRVSAGDESELQIVCGAANVRAGMRVPLAKIGAVLPDHMHITKATLRGVESSGMLCSAKELGLAESSSGLLTLPDDAPIGADLRLYLQLDDHSIELGLTPNRSDCLSVRGIAREVGVLNRMPVSGPTIAAVPPQSTREYPIRIEAPAQCPRYLGRVIEKVNPQAATPVWMQERLRRSGIRSISAIVDITNYMLLELGQPMHAFDLDRLRGGINVRLARPGERLTLLDAQTIELDAGTLLIADDQGPRALAGIMGGLDSAVSEATQTLFLESAFFAPAAIAGKARGYGLHTDSSHRFERGVDFQLPRKAIERASALILEIAGGVPGPVTESVHDKALPKRQWITLRPERIERLLGVSIPEDAASAILEYLDFSVTRESLVWRVQAPGFRFDIEREADLIEEIARIHGYVNIPARSTRISGAMLPVPETRLLPNQFRTVLVERGYQEVITYSFIAPALEKLLNAGLEPIRVANPISEDMAEMRTSLWPGLLKAMDHNQKRQQERIQIFESGLRFYAQADEIKQESMIAGLSWGAALPHQWDASDREVDFFDVKADIQALLALGGDPGAYRFTAEAHPALHPGQSARIWRGDREVGWIGVLHPERQRQFDTDKAIVLFELNVEEIAWKRLAKFQEISRFPAIQRDLAVIVAETISLEEVRNSVLRSAPASLVNFQLFDVYQGKGIDSGKKSIAFRLTLQTRERTLEEQDIDTAVADILAALQADVGAKLRE